MSSIRPCRDEERTDILAIVNAAAEAYRGVIPADRWREPYMDRPELDGAIAEGVAFWGYESGGALIGVMGIQPVDDVDLIRHAYVLPGNQRLGIGRADSALDLKSPQLSSLRLDSDRALGIIGDADARRRSLT